ncbi:ciliary neurotrophic factor receptor subunit alpha isoform X2 [Latimeria chalumnae]
MANIILSACCVVLAAVVMVYAQRHSQHGVRIQYERIGSDVTMQCGTLGSDASITWKVNGSDVDTSVLEGPNLILRNVTLSYNGLYSCFEDSSGDLQDQISLRIGSPPREPVVTCRSNTYPKGFYCTWYLPFPTYIPNDFELTALQNTKEIECQRDAVHKNKCHLKFYQMFSSLKYKVTVTAKNALGKSSATITFDEFSIVKPDPPEKVTAKPIPDNPRRLEVAWQTPSSWPEPDTFPLKFFLRYRPLILDKWQHVELSDTNSHTITDACTGKEYIIQVAAKDNDIGTWSDWSVPIHATPWMEELKPPTNENQPPLITTTTSSSSVPPQSPSYQVSATTRNSATTIPRTVSLLLGITIFLFI